MTPLPTSLPSSIHGTSVSIKGRGALILGPSGSGKSSLAIQLLSLGAGLICDDLTWLERPTAQQDIMLMPPPTSPHGQNTIGLEARGVGILQVPRHPPSPLSCVIDLSQQNTTRLPEERWCDICDNRVRLIHKVDNPAFPAMVLLYLQAI